jgi:hypothetical protein
VVIDSKVKVWLGGHLDKEELWFKRLGAFTKTSLYKSDEI